LAESFLGLSETERADALAVAADASGRPADLLEKDVWVVWSLEALFGEPFGEHLVFKGGTSLSKAYRVIARFSEDVDVTHDIRTLLPDLAHGATEPLPATRSQAEKWARLVRERLPEWVEGTALPALQARLTASNAPAEIHADAHRLRVRYHRVTNADTDYVAPEILIEFGARSTGEPARAMSVACDAAAYMSTLTFPTATPRVMSAERTFWEKATAIHVFCLQGTLDGERYARHWYDLVRLDGAGFAETALADRDLARAVAAHKGWFFREKDAAGQPVDYQAAVEGSLCLVPEGPALTLLADDYKRMIEAGLLEEMATPFDELMAKCADLQDRARRHGRGVIGN
jgi:hypothetical protein